MGVGIIVCGLNGAGKSTLGKALAEALNFHFIDDLDIYFRDKNSDNPYASPCIHDEAAERLSNEIKEHENFVFAAVTGDYGDTVCNSFKYAVLIDVPKDIRIERVRERSFKQFGDRMLSGGDLYEQEETFFDLVRNRPDNQVEEWLKSLLCPVIRIDGALPTCENVDLCVNEIRRELKLT